MRFESCDSKVALSIDRMRFRWRFRIDFPRFYCDSTHLFASRCGISGDSRQGTDSGNRAVRDSRFCAAEGQRKMGQKGKNMADVFLLAVGAFWLAVELFCLQSVHVLRDQSSHCKQKSSNCNQKSSKYNYKQRSSTVSRKPPTVSKKAASEKD